MNRLGLELAGAAAAASIVAGLSVGLVASHDANRRLTDQLAACGKVKDALTKQIKTQAAEEANRYAQTEADHLAACRDAYNAGAKRLRDDAAVAAGRYVPGAGAGHAGR